MNVILLIFVALFDSESAAVCSMVEVHTTVPGYRDNFNRLGINTIMSIDRSMIKMIYLMDILIAAVLMVVSVYLSENNYFRRG